MNEVEISLISSIQLTPEMYQQAQQFGAQQKSPLQGERVIRNYLAVRAVATYLQRFEIETDIQASNISDPVVQTLSDVADLKLSQMGSLHCQPISPQDQSVIIAPEHWRRYVAYIAVQLSDRLPRATLLGFVTTVEQETFSFCQLEPVKHLPPYLKQLDQLGAPSSVNEG